MVLVIVAHQLEYQWQTANDGYGYLEDRRPSANMDPYEVCAILIETTCS